MWDGDDDEDEEGSDWSEEEISPFKQARRFVEEDAEEVKRFKAVKDERRIKELVDPRRPSEKEVKEHEVHHLPYRNWCAICVKAKGKDMDHRKSVQEEKGVSEYSWDYCFPGDELGCKLVVLTGRERATGLYGATTVPTKGSMGQFRGGQGAGDDS